jgi:TPR repeat protein
MIKSRQQLSLAIDHNPPTSTTLDDGIIRMRSEDPAVRLLGEKVVLGFVMRRDPRAMVAMGDALIETDAARGVHYWKRAAEADYSPAMVRLGAREESMGRTRRAVNWFTRAAELGHPVGESWLEQLGVTRQATQMKL